MNYISRQDVQKVIRSHEQSCMQRFLDNGIDENVGTEVMTALCMVRWDVGKMPGIELENSEDCRECACDYSIEKLKKRKAELEAENDFLEKSNEMLRKENAALHKMLQAHDTIRAGHEGRPE